MSCELPRSKADQQRTGTGCHREALVYRGIHFFCAKQGRRGEEDGKKVSCRAEDLT